MDNCQCDSIPPLLKSLVSILINRQDIICASESQASLTIAQLIYFNAKSKCNQVSATRHVKDREPPLPIYLGLQVHTLTRSKSLVNSLYALGVSVSYKRVMELEDQLASAVSVHYEKEGIVCQPNLRKGLFTARALDNLDHNPSSTTAQGSFHGTAISIFQFPSTSNCGISGEPILINPLLAGKCSLPDNYTNVSAVACNTNTVTIPQSCTTRKKIIGHLDQAKMKELEWMHHGIQILQKEKFEKDYISWSAFHASLQNDLDNPSAITTLLPVL